MQLDFARSHLIVNQISPSYHSQTSSLAVMPNFDALISIALISYGIINVCAIASTSCPIAKDERLGLASSEGILSTHSRIRPVIRSILVQFHRGHPPSTYIQPRIHQPILAHGDLHPLCHNHISDHRTVNFSSSGSIHHMDIRLLRFRYDRRQYCQMGIEIFVQCRLVTQDSTKRRDGPKRYRFVVLQDFTRCQGE